MKFLVTIKTTRTAADGVVWTVTYEAEVVAADVFQAVAIVTGIPGGDPVESLSIELA